MSDNLWSLANILTGFSIAQSLTFLYALGRDLSQLQSKPLVVKKTISVFCFVFSGIYSFAVYRCMKMALTLPDQCIEIWQEVTWGREVGIWLFTALTIFGLFAPEFFQARIRK